MSDETRSCSSAGLIQFALERVAVFNGERAAAMKVPINQYDAISFDAPTLPAHEEIIRGRTRWRIWCKHCGVEHLHGPGEGHREAHCCEESSPYRRTGYNLALATEAQSGE